MKRIIIHIHRSLWITFTVLLMVLAIVLTGAHLLTPYLATQRSTVERWTSTFLDQPVRIGSIKMSWEKFTPVLKCTQVEILNDAKTKSLLKVDELDTSVNVVQSLLRGHIQLGELTIQGAQLTMHQKPDGSIMLNGLGAIRAKQPTIASEDSLDTYLDWLLVAPRLSLRNINLNWYDSNGKLLPISNLDLNLHNALGKNTLWGEASLAQKVPSRLKFVVELSGAWRQKQSLNVKFYLKGQDVLLAQWLANRPLGGFTADQGIADFEIWGDFARGQGQSLQSKFLVKQVALQKPATAPLLIAHGAGNIFWQMKSDGWHLDALFENLSFSRWGKIPGFDGLSGFLHATTDAGFVQLASKNIRADFGSLFRSALLLDQLSGTVKWIHDNDGLHIQAADANVQTEDAAVRADMDLLLPSDHSSPVISLLAGYRMVGRAHLVDYLPVGILSPGLVHWLDHSITKSNLATGSMVLQGPLASFPFDHNEGRFIVDTQLSGVDLNYWPHWPPVKAITGELIFAERSMEVIVDSAKVFSTPVNQLHAAIPLLKKNVPATLQIDGTLSGDASDGVKFLQQSPLSDDLGINTNAEMRGPIQLQLHLAIPLGSEKNIPLKVDGQVVLQNNTLKIPDKDLKLDRINGQLNFTRNSLTAPKLTAELWNKPIQINISTPNKKPQLQIHYDDILANLIASENAWLLSLRSPTMDGQVSIPSDSKQTIQANFNYLAFTPGSGKTFDQLKPYNIPKISIIANDVRYGEKKLGQLQLQLTPISDGVQITSVQLSSPNYRLQAHGNWSFINGSNETQFTGELNSQNVAAALASMGFPASIKADQSVLRFNLTWPKAAYDPSFSGMDGNISIGLQKGEIVNIGSEAAAKMDIGRLLSILSFQSLERRLKLDFSDLTSHGFSFDSLTGTFRLQNGNAYTQDTTIKATVADVGISGRIGLGSEDYDLQLSVTPHLTSTLPLIVGLATGPVGPIAGAATWVASKIVGSTVDKISTDFYRMSGSWSDPKIQQVGNFFTQVPTSKAN